MSETMLVRDYAHGLLSLETLEKLLSVVEENGGKSVCHCDGCSALHRISMASVGAQSACAQLRSLIVDLAQEVEARASLLDGRGVRRLMEVAMEEP